MKFRFIWSLSAIITAWNAQSYIKNSIFTVWRRLNSIKNWLNFLKALNQCKRQTLDPIWQMRASMLEVNRTGKRKETGITKYNKKSLQLSVSMPIHNSMNNKHLPWAGLLQVRINFSRLQGWKILSQERQASLFSKIARAFTKAVKEIIKCKKSLLAKAVEIRITFHRSAGNHQGKIATMRFLRFSRNLRHS